MTAKPWRVIPVIFLLLVSLFSISAGEAAWKMEGVRLYNLGIMVPSGIDVSLTKPAEFEISGYEGSIYFKIGGGYEERPLYRYADGEPVYSTESFSDDLTELDRTMPNLQTETGFLIKKGKIEIFTLSRQRLDYYFAPDSYDTVPFLYSQPDSEFADADGLFGNSILLGMDYFSVIKEQERLQKGIYSEVSIELAPEWLGNSIFGNSDYYRLNFTFGLFQPLRRSRPVSSVRGPGVYSAVFFTVDYISGDSIPIYALQSVGGRELRPALGGLVRGYEKYSMDTKLKSASSLELRFFGPEMAAGNIILLAFSSLDAGFYYQFAEIPEGSDAKNDYGFPVSAGAGTGIILSRKIEITFGVAFPLTLERLDGKNAAVVAGMGFHF